MSDASFTDEQLRDELTRVARLDEGGSHCPPADRLVSSARGELDPRSDRPVVVHIARCTACAAAWRVAREVASTGSGSETLSAGRTSVRYVWLRWAAAAALIVVAVGLGIVFVGPERETAPVYREQEGPLLRSLLDERQPLPRDLFVLRWTPGPEGTFYDLRVMTSKLETLARVERLDRAEFQVPEESLATLAPGSRVLWQVTALLPTGQRVESETFFVEVE